MKSRGTKKCAPLLLLLLLVVFLLANVDARAEDDFYALRDSYDGTSPDILALFFPRGVWLTRAHFNGRRVARMDFVCRERERKIALL